MADSDYSWQRLAAAYIYKQLIALQEHLPRMSEGQAIEPLHLCFRKSPRSL